MSKTSRSAQVKPIPPDMQVVLRLVEDDTTAVRSGGGVQMRP